MLYLYLLIFSIAVGIIRKGKYQNLTQISLQKVELILAAFLIQAILIFLASRQINLIIHYGNFLFIFSYLILLIAVWYNYELKGMNLIFLGVLLNFLVILFNGGHMPVLMESLNRVGLENFARSLQEGDSITHILINNKTLFKFLADVIPLPPPFPDPSVISIGDFLMFCGVFIFIQDVMTAKKEKEKEF
ncbi:MAG: hypothetical protein Kow00103_12900 [Candidatus Caldatribacteriota bacterium]